MHVAFTGWCVFIYLLGIRNELSKFCRYDIATGKHYIIGSYSIVTYMEKLYVVVLRA